MSPHKTSSVSNGEELMSHVCPYFVPAQYLEKVDDINNIAKILETKINSAINKEKETVVTMQEKTNELIEENRQLISRLKLHEIGE